MTLEVAKLIRSHLPGAARLPGYRLPVQVTGVHGSLENGSAPDARGTAIEIRRPWGRAIRRELLDQVPEAQDVRDRRALRATWTRPLAVARRRLVGCTCATAAVAFSSSALPFQLKQSGWVRVASSNEAVPGGILRREVLLCPNFGLYVLTPDFMSDIRTDIRDWMPS